MNLDDFVQSAQFRLTERQRRAKLIQTMTELLESHDVQDIIDAAREAQYHLNCEDRERQP